VLKNANGTWSWSHTPTTYLNNVPVTITANDGVNSSMVTFNITANTFAAGRSVFYNNATGANLSSAGAANNAIDTSKSVLRTPGATSTFANYTNYSRGLNGLIVDIAGLPTTITNAQMLVSLHFAHWNAISAGGFAALPVAAVPTVTLLSNSGVGGSARIKITFPDNTLQNTWLRVTVLANNTTGLASNDVFYFGNVIGEINTGNTATRLRVNATDTGAVRSNQSTAANSASVTNIFDVNRDGRVNATDTGIVRSNQQTAGIVAPLTVPGAIPPAGAFGIPPQPVAPKKPSGEPDQGGEGEMGGGGASGVDSTLVPTPDLGTLLVSKSNSPSTVGQDLKHNGLEDALSKGTTSAVSLPQNLGSVLAAATFASSPTDKKSSEDKEREIVADLFAGLAKENLSDFFS
jgi:hypothetical protein